MATAQLQLLSEGAAAAGPGIPDHRLALMFARAYPAIESGIHAPLMLQVVLGLDPALWDSHVMWGLKRCSAVPSG